MMDSSDSANLMKKQNKDGISSGGKFETGIFHYNCIYMLLIPVEITVSEQLL